MVECRDQGDEQKIDALIWVIDLLLERSFERLTNGELTNTQYLEETETLRRFTSLAQAWLDCYVNGR